jgi:hypothetical protein
LVVFGTWLSLNDIAIEHITFLFLNSQFISNF